MTNITADDIGNAFRDALAMLPDDSKVYNMPIADEYDDSLLLEGRSPWPLTKKNEPIFSKEEVQAMEKFFSEYKEIRDKENDLETN